MGEDAGHETPSPFAALVGLVPDVIFAVVRDLQHTTVRMVRATARVPLATVATIVDSAPMQRPMAIVETQLKPIAARGAQWRREDVEEARAAIVRIEPTLSAFLERAVEIIPIDALLARVDVDALISRIDVDGLLRRIDVNAMLGRVDIGGLVEGVLEGIELGDLIQSSTSSIATDARDAVRVQAMNADGILAAIMDRILLRKRERDLVLPGYQPSGAM
jgi:hypothetical protein